MATIHHDEPVAMDSGSTRDISVIIVNYNVRDFLEQCLRSIAKACQGLKAEVFVVDNASRDHSCEMVRDQFPWVHMIENRVNLGFSMANNQALRLARGRYVLLINPDTLAREDTIQTMVAFLDEHPQAGAVGCKILNPDGTLQLSCRRSFPTPWVALSKILGLGRLFPKSRLFGQYNLTFLDPDKIWEVDALSGSFMCLRRKTLEQVGLLDEQYFMYGEDLDLCYRIKRSGWKIHYVPSTQIIHYKGKSTEVSTSTVLDFYRAMYIFVRKHLRRRYLFFLHWFLVLGIAARAAMSFAGQMIRRAFPLLLDLTSINLALLAAILLRFGQFIPLPPFENFYSYLLLHGASSLIWVGSFWALGLYDRRRYSPVQAFWAATLSFLLISTLTYFKKEYAFSRIAILTSYLLSLVLATGWRLLFRIAVKTPVGRALIFKRAAIVGANEVGLAILARLRGRLDLGSRVVGFIRGGSGEHLDVLAGLPVLGNVEDLPRIVKEENIDEVIVTTSSHSYGAILEVVSRCADLPVNVKLIPSPYEVMIGGTQIDRIDGIPLVEIRYRPLLAWNRVVKRAADVILAGGLLILTAPLALVWRLLRWRRPERYRCVGRIVAGRGDRPVTLVSHQILDPRGNDQDRWRRLHYRWAMDKLPLLVSVFRGDLSLVGPEPLPLGTAHVSVIRPGLTGFVQIHLKEGLTPEEKQEYQIYYLRHQSLMLDVQVLWRTLWDFIRGPKNRMATPRMGARESPLSSGSRSLAERERAQDERVRSRI